MNRKPYGLICPITHACNVLEPRWTIPILTEMWGGSTRFNDIRRGVGNISPALLSRRLRELIAHGLIERLEDPASGQVDYVRTQRAVDLEPALDALGRWAQCNIEATTALADLDVSTLMWQMRGYIDPDQLPNRQVIIQFRFSDPELDYTTYWALVRPGAPVEICSTKPSCDVDLFVETNRLSLSSILLSRTTIGRELEHGHLFLSGDAILSHTMDRWLYHRTKERPNEALQLGERRRSQLAMASDGPVSSSPQQRMT
ncbi:MAG: helix-turn-helix domain-containing protein [Hoeflea sp.]|uniref:winged helix-turn-helix transcriptional regulator n=1 Tax=Hoeflea sp. TaxID=1940281 RepID=UPI002730ADA8|nr:helix-turn-helix domain-containing protein [Hoeflea sp.]MDP2122202.1 helix-turn-helix domain-containing protein [Hoeflea sp.]MDZ7601347.1 helix-turn-helix domain-containing protein [Hoeflea sp.]